MNAGHGPVTLEGVGLHSGAPSRVTLRTCDGPSRLRQGGLEGRMDELEVVASARATTVALRRGPHAGALRVGTVEHALAALAGLGLHDGVALEVEGPELPLLDGGASAWCAALARLGVAASRPRLRVTRAATFTVGPSRFDFAPDAVGDLASEPPSDGDDARVHVDVRIDFDDARLAPEATWRGDPDDFRARIAPARTFALAREVDELARRGLARHVDPGSVVVIAPDAILHAGRPFSADEPARHKLLDLLGDMFLHGGPPLGRVQAFRPGHAASARALGLALAQGVLTAS